MPNLTTSFQTIVGNYKSSATKLFTSNMQKRVDSNLASLSTQMTELDNASAATHGKALPSPQQAAKTLAQATSAAELSLNALEQLFSSLRRERQTFINNKALVEQKALFATDKVQSELDQKLLASMRNLANSILFANGQNYLPPPKTIIRSKEDLLAVDTSSFEAWLTGFAAQFR
ncbi:MAG: hypothetical protein GYB52_03025 [Rhodospirillales bacterium]|nr:hypothetical protein [Rhodospirillales bacterium]MBR9815579.1 hypothetical protein [Rhodospirillales bacterium]